MPRWAAALASVLVLLALALPLATPAFALPSGGITEWSDSVHVEPPSPPGVVTPESIALAQSAQSLALWATGGLSLTGVALMASGSHNGNSDGMQGLGLAMLGTGVLFGPSMGWARAGYWDRAVGGALVRTVIVGAGFTAGIGLGLASDSGWEGLGIVLLGVTAGVCTASIEGLVECGRMDRYIREHGAGGRAHVSMLTPHGPGLAVTVPLP